jgi:hypothetical protein
MRPSLLCLLLIGCAPWNEIAGPTIGAGVTYHEGRGWTPQINAGYAFERFRFPAGYGAEAHLAVEPWTRSASLAVLGYGRAPFVGAGAGPVLALDAGRLRFGLAVAVTVLIALGEPSTCTDEGSAPDCLGADSTVYPAYLPRLRFGGLLLFGGAPDLSIGADVVVSGTYLRTGERKPDEP